jgi:hypothetical protein
MRYVAGALVGSILGAVLGWLVAGVADLLIEPALLLIEITSVLGLVLGAVAARRFRKAAAAQVPTR